MNLKNKYSKNIFEKELLNYPVYTGKLVEKGERVPEADTETDYIFYLRSQS